MLPNDDLGLARGTMAISGYRMLRRLPGSPPVEASRVDWICLVRFQPLCSDIRIRLAMNGLHGPVETWGSLGWNP